jgi:putative membrane protein
VLELVFKIVGALILVALGVAYVRGWRRLAGAGHPPPSWRLALYVFALVALALALLGLDEAADSRFSWHMIQHLLLVMVAAPLVLLGNPLPLVMWGLSHTVRCRLAAATLRPATTVRRALVMLSSLPVAGALYVITVWGWHLPALYEAAPSTSSSTSSSTPCCWGPRCCSGGRSSGRRRGFGRRRTPAW